MVAERFPIEAGHIMMFARALGDSNPVYLDEPTAARSEVGGIIAPPTFFQAAAHFDPDYHLRPHADRAWFGSGRRATDDPGTAQQRSGRLHAEQHFEYRRPVRAGETLGVRSVPGGSWEKRSRSGANLSFTEEITEYLDVEGHVVVVSRLVAVRVVEQEA